MDELGPDVQLLLATFEAFRPDDYIDAQRLRAALRRQTAELLADVDLIALPTTQRAAPPVTDEEARSGFIDPAMLAAMSRFSFLGNLTGLPAGTAPVGANEDGLPVGLQLIGDAWDEATVLQALAHLERVGAARVARPPAAVELF
jgi:aspartyl-tRNA(Asn)/glutamyl-tRNA(Gln) amidotransferase subunit A